MESMIQVSVILRPRRFGKSTNLSLLKSFLEIGADKTKFDHLKVARDTRTMKHFENYPVIYLNLKECKGDSWDEKISQTYLQKTIVQFLPCYPNHFHHPVVRI